VLRYVLLGLRPKQWTKNAVVFAGLVFARKLGEPELLGRTALAFALFCLVSGAVYLLNDLADLAQDRTHPLKRQRPLAAGLLAPWQARLAALVLLGTCLPLGLLLEARFGAALIAYAVLQGAYSLTLKHVVILDVLAIAAGFVLRAAAGAWVISVPLSPWLLVCTILLALFLGLAKRRHELVLLAGAAGQHRAVLRGYSEPLLHDLLSVVSSATIMAYALYTFSAENLPSNHAMMLTIPFVLYGIFRYLYLVHQSNQGGSPELVLLKDTPLLASIVLWALTAAAILYLVP
jgi:4-hydroxybenzoate polyprenyltransferase